MNCPGVADTITVIIGAGAGVITAAGYSLNKLGLLHFGKKEKIASTPCAVHSEFQEMLNHVKTTQLINIQKYEQNRRSLEAGERKFDTLQEAVGELNEGIGILMDRTGGRPPEWRRGSKR